MQPSGSGRRFTIHACLGRGGFGEVYRATMASSGGVTSEVAVKILRADIDPGSEAVKRLRDEGRLLGALRHPSILRVHDLVLLDKRVALVTEYIDGEDLDRCIHSSPPMPPRVLFAVVGEIASALNVAYNSPAPGADGPMHLVHRDVKPANIRIGKHGEVKLLDFGIARAANVVREAHTANNAMMGSCHYMAPERFHEDEVYPPSDMYALGCILFEGLTGERLFGDKSVKQIYGTMLSEGRFTEFLAGRLELLAAQPEAIRKHVVALLALNPEERPTAAALASDFEDLAEDTPGPTLKRWSRTREWPAPDLPHGSLNGQEIESESFVSVRPPTPLPESRSLDPLAPGLLGGDLLGGFDPLGPPPPRKLTPLAAPMATAPPVREPDPPVREPESIDLPDIPARDDRSMDAPLPRAATPLPAPRADAPTAPLKPPAAPAPPAPHPAAPAPAADPVQAESAPAPAADPVQTTPTAGPAQEPNVAFPQPAPLTETHSPQVDRDESPTYHPEAEEPAPRFGPPPSLPPPSAPPPPPPTPKPAPSRSPSAPPTHATIAPAADSDLDSMWLGDDPGPAPEPIPGVFDEPLVGFGGTGEDAAFERELEAMAARRSRSTRLRLLGVFATLFLVIGCGGAYAAYSSFVLGDQVVEPVREAPKPAAPAAVEAPDKPNDAANIAKPEPTPSPKSPAPAAPAPAPAPSPKAAPAAAPKATSAKALCAKGWNTVDGNPKKAESLFRKALTVSPGNPEASYGLGYALLKLKRPGDATPHLCLSVKRGSGADKRDAESILVQNGLTCD